MTRRPMPRRPSARVHLHTLCRMASILRSWGRPQHGHLGTARRWFQGPNRSSAEEMATRIEDAVKPIFTATGALKPKKNMQLRSASLLGRGSKHVCLVNKRWTQRLQPMKLPTCRRSGLTSSLELLGPDYFRRQVPCWRQKRRAHWSMLINSASRAALRWRHQASDHFSRGV